jgi:hypothetical protein
MSKADARYDERAWISSFRDRQSMATTTCFSAVGDYEVRHYVRVMHYSDLDIKSAFEHYHLMRTTINLDDDVLEKVKRHAEGRSVSIGTAVSELVRRGLEFRRPTRVVNGIYVVDLPPDSPEVTSESVRRVLDKEE